MSTSKTKSKPNSKASYAMAYEKLEKPKTSNVPLTSNKFQILRNIPKFAQTYAQITTSNQVSCNYVIRAHLMKVQVLETSSLFKICFFDFFFKKNSKDQIFPSK